MVARKPGRQGEHGVSVKTTAQGRPDVSAEPVCSCAAFFEAQWHTRPRVRRAPGLPRALSRGSRAPSSRRGAELFCKTRGQCVARMRAYVWSCRVGKATTSAVAQRGQAEACPPIAWMTEDGGHGASAPLPTLRCLCSELDAFSKQQGEGLRVPTRGPGRRVSRTGSTPIPRRRCG
jgi:hypothetical protein